MTAVDSLYHSLTHVIHPCSKTLKRCSAAAAAESYVAAATAADIYSAGKSERLLTLCNPRARWLSSMIFHFATNTLLVITRLIIFVSAETRKTDSVINLWEIEAGQNW
jgi:hypothetical protein